MWDERYNSDDYAYGTDPNEFLRDHFDQIPIGRVLSLGEGEGRNGVFLARQGYSVTAVDGSVVGLEKARKLAKQHGVEIKLIHADLAEYDLGENAWQGIVSIFVPLPSWLRRQIYQAIPRALSQGGVFLLEAYTPNQLRHGTGGGSSVDTMQSVETLRDELKGLEFTRLEELERHVIEGSFHTGLGSVVQAVARKPNLT